MAGFFPQQWLDELRSRADIVSVVSEYVPLTQKGRRYWGCCPFHQEKTPSFSVDSEKQMYYCFGCKAAGNVISFVMSAERLGFVDAVKYLAEKFNVPLPQNEEDEARYRKMRQEQERMFSIMTTAARFFRDRLYEPEGEAARGYLKRRDVSEAMVRRFGLGYAPDSWNALKDHLEKNGIPAQEAQKLGLLSESKGRKYDAFRGRLMYPIFDERGRVVAFGGRVLGDGHPKYINSPETPIFNKRRQLYGLHLLKKEHDVKSAIIVEGYMDVIAMWQAGIGGAMATMGTSMTEEQARLLRRYVPRVVLVYDGDAAGQHATLRGMDILREAGLEVRVASLPDNLDPDEMVRQRGAQAMRDELDRAMTLTAFRMASEKKNWDLSDSEQRTHYAVAAAKIIAAIESPVEREMYLKTLQVETGFSMEALNAQTAAAPQESASAENSGGMNKKTTGSYHNRELTPSSPDVRAQRELIRALMQTPFAQWPKQARQLQDEDFDCPACRRALALVKEAEAQGRQIELADIYTRLAADGDEQTAAALTAAPEEAPDMEAVAEWIARRISRRQQRKIAQLQEKLNDASLGDAEKLELLGQIQSLQQKHD